MKTADIAASIILAVIGFCVVMSNNLITTAVGIIFFASIYLERR